MGSLLCQIPLKPLGFSCAKNSDTGLPGGTTLKGTHPGERAGSAVTPQDSRPVLACDRPIPFQEESSSDISLDKAQYQESHSLKNGAEGWQALGGLGPWAAL